MSSNCDFSRVLSAAGILLTLAACATTGTTNAGGISGVGAPVASSVTLGGSLASADSAWRAEQYPLATALYEAIVARDPSAAIAVFRLATLRSWDGRLDEAIVLYRRYLVLAPGNTEGRLGLARVTAFKGQHSASVAIYDSIIAREPNNREAALGRAQTLAWDGQLVEAERLYATLAAIGNAEAKKGLARVIGWRGDLVRSERTWRQVVVADPADAEALTGLAQVLSWQGRQLEAESTLQLALRANPSYGDARALLRWVRADISPSVTVSGVGANDSDNNRATGFVVDYIARAPWSGTVGARYTERWANFAAIDSRADAVNIFGRWQPAGSSWQVRADAGATRHASTLVLTPEREQTMVSGGLRTSGKLARALTIGLGVSRSPFDETAMLIASGVVSTEATAEAEIELPGPFSWSAGGSHARLTGGASENSRNAFSSVLRWVHNRRWSLAVGGRQFGYDTPSTDGYFAPKKYTLAELTGRGRVGGDLGWSAEGDVGVGRQSLEFFGSSAGSRRAERVALTAGYRFGPAHELSVSGSYANVAGPGQTGGSEYKAYTFAVRARLGL